MRARASSWSGQEDERGRAHARLSQLVGVEPRREERDSAQTAWRGGGERRVRARVIAQLAGADGRRAPTTSDRPPL